MNMIEVAGEARRYEGVGEYDEGQDHLSTLGCEPDPWAWGESPLSGGSGSGTMLVGR